MVVGKNTGGYLVRLNRGELLVKSLSEFVAKEEIKTAWVSGLGGALWAELAFYHLDRKAYEYDRIDELLEVASLTGNVSLLNGKPFLHLHAVVADLNYHAYAGHVKELAAGATLELRVEVLKMPVERVHNEECGLKVLDL